MYIEERMGKPFDRTEYNKYDSAGKQAAICYWKSIDPEISITPGGDRYAKDLHFSSPLRKESGYIEPEVKAYWNYEGPFIDDEIRIPVRKAKYFGSNCYFMIVNALYTDAFIINESALKKCETGKINVNGKRFGNIDDDFFFIPHQQIINNGGNAWFVKIPQQGNQDSIIFDDGNLFDNIKENLSKENRKMEDQRDRMADEASQINDGPKKEYPEEVKTPSGMSNVIRFLEGSGSYRKYFISNSLNLESCVSSKESDNTISSSLVLFPI